MITIKGTLVFDPVSITKKHLAQSSWKKVAMVKLDGDIDDYYAWFLKKRFNLTLNPSIRGAHVTIISDKIEDSLYKQAYDAFNGKTITLEYDPEEVRSNGEHWWLKMYSQDSKNIRTAIGLTPDPFFSLHMTLGYANEKNMDHSVYILDTIKRHKL